MSRRERDGRRASGVVEARGADGFFASINTRGWQIRVAPVRAFVVKKRPLVVHERTTRRTVYSLRSFGGAATMTPDRLPSFFAISGVVIPWSLFPSPCPSFHPIFIIIFSAGVSFRSGRGGGGGGIGCAAEEGPSPAPPARVAGLHRRARLAADLRRAPARGAPRVASLARASAARWPSSTSLCASRAPRRLRSARELALLRARLVRVRTRGDVLVLHVRAERAPRGGGGGGRGGGGDRRLAGRWLLAGGDGIARDRVRRRRLLRPRELGLARAQSRRLRLEHLGVGHRRGGLSRRRAELAPRAGPAPRHVGTGPGRLPRTVAFSPGVLRRGEISEQSHRGGEAKGEPVGVDVAKRARRPRARLSAVKETRLKKCSRIAASGCLSEGGARNLNAATLRLERLERRRARRPRALPPRARANESTRCGACSASSPIASRTRSTRVRLPRGCPQKKTLRRSRRSDLASAPLPAHAPASPSLFPPRRRRPRARSRRH